MTQAFDLLPYICHRSTQAATSMSFNSANENETLRVLPCHDIGSQRCWLGQTFMKSHGLKLGEVITICIGSAETYMCRIWPRIDIGNDTYIRFDRTVGKLLSNMKLSSTVVAKCTSIPHSAVCKTFSSALTHLTVTVVVNDHRTMATYKRNCSELLVGHIRNILKGLIVAASYTVRCSLLTLGSVYCWNRIIVHSISTKKQTQAGVIVNSTQITIKELHTKAKFERNCRGPVKLGGLKLEIQMLKEIVLQSHSPAENTNAGKTFQAAVDGIHGVLLTGPPGCGKKSLVHHVAIECDAFLVHVNSSVHGARPGDSERNLRSAFQEAANVSIEEPCILFLDELDAICPRKQGSANEGDALATRMLAELLTLMDSMHEMKNKFVVIATSDKPTNIEPCLRRFGRFEKELFIGIPGESQRLEILKLLVPHKAVADDVDLYHLSSITAGYTGADLTSIISVAVVHALDCSPEFTKHQEIALQVNMEDFYAGLHLVRPSVQGASDMFITVKKSIAWNDIGGLHKVKQQLIQSIEWPRKYPDICRAFGLRPAHGILLHGPPGCAKTSLARAAAASCNVNFLAASSAQLYSPFFGDAEKQIDELFRQARACAPSLLFIDEIDSVIGIRASSADSSNSVQQRVLSALLTQMDGIGMKVDELQRHQGNNENDGRDLHKQTDEADILVMAATNRLDMVDSALLRPGRMDHIIYIPPPDLEARLEILKVYTSTKPIVDVDLVDLAQRTDGFTGADLENLCNEASLDAIQKEGENSRHITRENFDDVLLRIKPSVSSIELKQYLQMNKS